MRWNSYCSIEIQRKRRDSRSPRCWFSRLTNPQFLQVQERTQSGNLSLAIRFGSGQGPKKSVYPLSSSLRANFRAKTKKGRKEIDGARVLCFPRGRIGMAQAHNECDSCCGPRSLATNCIPLRLKTEIISGVTIRDKNKCIHLKKSQAATSKSVLQKGSKIA